MNWKDLKLSWKLLSGFGMVTLIMVVISFREVNGVGDIVHNAGSVITGNEIKGKMVQKEVDHLNRVAELTRFISNDGRGTLSVETDYHPCGSGKWYFGESRKRAEGLFPGLISIFPKIENPPYNPHNSAKTIKKLINDANGDVAGVEKAKVAFREKSLPALNAAIGVAIAGDAGRGSKGTIPLNSGTKW